MPVCPNCGATVSEGQVYCGNCGVAMNSPATSKSTSQPQESPTGLNVPSSSDMVARLEKATRRTELLSYAVAGLAVAILAVIIGIAFL